MERARKYEKAFALLSDAAVRYGVDRVVKDPIDFIMRSLSISQPSAWICLKELERRELIAYNFEGVRISSVRLLRKELPDRLYEVDDMTRTLSALYKYRHASKSDPKKQIVHSSFFGNIQGEADILNVQLYVNLKRFSENGWIELVYSGVTKCPKIVYVVIKDGFPTHLVQ